MDAPPVLAGIAQGGALFDAEAVLFVDDDQREVRETHAVLEQGVRAHDDEGRVGGHRRGDFAARRRRRRARQQAHVGGVVPQGCEEVS